MPDAFSPGRDPQRLLARLRSQLPRAAGASVLERVPLPAHVHPAPTDPTRNPLGPPPPTASPHWAPISAGAPWGRRTALGLWGFPFDGGTVVWLRSTITVPVGGVRPGEELLLELSDPSGDGQAIHLEALAVLDGVVLAGLDAEHEQVVLPDDVVDGAEHELLLQVTLAADRPFQGLWLLRRDAALWRYGVTARCLLDVVAAVPQTSPDRARLLRELDASYRLLPLREGWDSPQVRAAAPAALEVLRAALPVEASGGAACGPSIVAAGHGHLDVAWLWSFWRTRQKAVHTAATALRLMARDPDYHFSMSSPQVWSWIKQDAPELWERLRDRVSQGRVEPVGAMWLESDCNLPAGESFVRQFHYGLAFFEREFGISPRVAFLPDCFGFSAALPQLMHLAGVEALVTTKLSWNRVNRMPEDTFRWVGLDGTGVVAHFVTTTSQDVPESGDPVWQTYCGAMTAAELAGAWAHYRSKDVNSELLCLYGYGDGGGGPTEEMLANRAVLERIPALGQLRAGTVGTFVDELLQRLDAEGAPPLGEWAGDLYLEGHLGTFTSQRVAKRANRDGELALREAEWLCAWAHALGAPDRQAVLDTQWETVLRHQFHDVLPGSSIPAVYEDVRRESAAALDVVRLEGARALAQVAGDGDQALVLNPTPWRRSGVVEVDGLVLPVRVDGLAAAVLERDLDAEPVRLDADGDGWVLDNGRVRARIGGDGAVTSLRAVVAGVCGRELVTAGGRAGRLVLCEDRPLFWDAWDIDPYYGDKAIALDEVAQTAVDAPTPWRACVRVTLRSGETTIEQRYVLDAGADHLLVRTEVDWHERQMLLRAHFDWDTAARHATFGRQFGSVEVPVHRNTTWEQARYEVVAHGFADVSDADAGVALLTDAIYGHSVSRAGIGLSLLKSPAWPDPGADQGRHGFRYALAPHAGPWDGEATARAAAQLAQPLRVVRGARAAAPLVRVEGRNAVAETVKAAWDGDGLVVRLWEAASGRATATITSGDPGRAIVGARRCDLRERPLPGGEVSLDAGVVHVALRPHEVATVRLRLEE